MQPNATPCYIFRLDYQIIAKTATPNCRYNAKRERALICYPHVMPTIAPSSLGPIDAVEIVTLRGIDPRRVDRVDQYESAATDAPRIRLTGPDAKRIATLWRTLPPAT